MRGGMARAAAAGQQRSRAGDERRDATMPDAMKRLFLLRHAKSSWEDADLTDHDRPLAPRGRRAAKLMAGYREREAIAPSLVLCSSALRTRETLERLGFSVDDEAEVVVERGLYAASATELLERLRGVEPGSIR